MIIIGVAGGSGSGKTSIVKEIVKRLPKNSTQIIPQDNYYKDLSHLSVAERQEINFDHPDSLDFELMAKHLRQLKKGEPVAIPTYSFADHNRAVETQLIEPKDYIILDGILIFSNNALRKTMDYLVYVDMDEATRFERRLKRDVEERGRTRADVKRQCEATVMPSHNRFIEPSKRYADFIVPGLVANRTGIDMLLAVLSA